MDVEKAVKEQKAGMVNYRTDKDGNVHMPMGRVSFTEEALKENFLTVKDLILKVKPSTVKGTYVKNVVISTTMGPSIKVEL
jgi:large subunit ribosomal protein L1